MEQGYLWLQQLLYALRQPGLLSTVVRLACTMVFGGLVGLERERKGRPAGFRTYMLVCLGAALAMMLSQYELEMLATRWQATATLVGVKTDVARIGAQAINGIGFLGAGTVLVVGRQKEVKGLTTAAGLWACACVGLAIGAGFYECMLVALGLILLSIRVLPTIEQMLLTESRNMNLYLELEDVSCITPALQLLERWNIRVFDLDLDPGQSKKGRLPNAVLDLRLPAHTVHAVVLAALAELDGICTLEEI